MTVKNIMYKRKVQKLTYSATQAAKVIGVDVNALKELIKLGYIKDLKLGAQKIPKWEIERFIREGAELEIDYNEILKKGIKKGDANHEAA